MSVYRYTDCMKKEYLYVILVVEIMAILLVGFYLWQVYVAHTDLSRESGGASKDVVQRSVEADTRDPEISAAKDAGQGDYGIGEGAPLFNSNKLQEQ